MKTSLPKLDLELLPAGWRKRLSGWLVLALGATCFVAVLRHDLQLRQSITETGAVAGLQDTPSAQAAPQNPEETKAVQDAIAKLGLPWGRLFAAIEAHAGEQVQLLAVTPEAGQGTVTLEAQAPDVYGMLEYVRALTAEPALSSVVLGSYEIAGEQAATTVRFTITAQWRPAP